MIVTCLSEHSRNRKAGIIIGEGGTVKEAREKIIAIENNQKKITITSSVAAPIVANRKKVPPSRGTMVEGGGMGTVFL